MKGSLQIARVRGIPIKVHLSFLLVLPLLAALFASRMQLAAEAAGVPGRPLMALFLLWGLGLALGLFLTVLLHELAHALYAVKHGVQVESITLLMVGGMTQMGDTPERPRDEALMALVGPLTSVALGALLLLGGWALRDTDLFSIRFVLASLGAMNLALAVFNLLPSFPMDGGRILRALLTPRLGRVRATRTAANIGSVFAALFALGGLLMGNIFLVLIAWFVFLGAQGEAQQVKMKDLLAGMRVRELMRPTTEALSPAEPLEAALEKMRQARRMAMPVAWHGRVVGVLALDQVQRMPPERLARASVGELMRTPVPEVTPEEDVWSAVLRMTKARVPLLPVTEDGRWVGTLEQHEVARAVTEAEVRRRQARGGARRQLPA